MKSVVCFGEALIDFLNTGEQIDGALNLKNYRQYPGGAPANAAVAISKLGGKSYFAGQVGDDAFGEFLDNALQQYGVHTDLLIKHPFAKTALAFVLLDSEGDRSFSFYRHQTADILFERAQVKDSWFEQQPIFHFCSNTLTDTNIENTTFEAVSKAKAHRSLVSFDVNLRHNLWSQGQADASIVNEFVIAADVIKFSREELDYLAAGNNQAYIENIIEQGVSLLVITDGAHDIVYHGKNSDGSLYHDSISAPRVTAVDTTAGGDAFSGALLFALSQLNDPWTALDDPQLIHQLITFASTCGAHAVTKPGAFPALPTFSDVQQHWPLALLPTK